MNQVSLICTTYRRYRCIERIIKQFLSQDYCDLELVLFNTDTDVPLTLSAELTSERITLVNNSIDYETGKAYTNRGAICRDAVTHATGNLFMLMDDDDVYLPWHVRQAVDGIMANGKDAWKPQMSFFATPNRLELTKNTLEASVIVKMNRIREIGFRTDATGYEGLSWYTKLRDEGQLDENFTHFIPSYCFNWADPADMAGHKQSGDINNPNNFDNHKAASTDVSEKPLACCEAGVIESLHEKFYRFLADTRNSYDSTLWERYVSSHIGPN